jgi:hypothetical protein
MHVIANGATCGVTMRCEFSGFYEENPFLIALGVMVIANPYCWGMSRMRGSELLRLRWRLEPLHNSPTLASLEWGTQLVLSSPRDDTSAIAMR